MKALFKVLLIIGLLLTGSLVIDGQEVSPEQESMADFDLNKIKLPKSLVRSMALYKSLTGYRDTTTIEMHMVSDNMDNRMNTQVLFAYEKPNRVRIENNVDRGGEMKLFSNGEKMISYFGVLKQFTEEDAPEVLTPANLQLTLNNQSIPMVLSLIARNIIMSVNPLEDMKKGIVEVKKVGREKLDGISTTIFELMPSASWLAAGMVQGDVGEDMMIPIRFWIGRKDNLIRKMTIEQDMEQLAQNKSEKQQTAMKGMKLRITERHFGIEISPDFSNKNFDFIPPEGAQLVDNFSFPSSPGSEEPKIIGKPAPDFTLKDRNGNNEKQADLGANMAIVKRGERAVVFKKFSTGLDKDNVLSYGVHSIDKGDVLIRYDVREQKIEEKMDVLDKKGLSVLVDVSLIFNPIYNRIGYLHENIGRNYVSVMVIPTVRNSVRAVIGRYSAEEIFSTKRREVETEIIDTTRKVLANKNIQMKDLLIRDITLPEKKEKEAIKAVIEEERDAFFARDLTRFEAIWKKGPTSRRVFTSTNAVSVLDGWQEIHSNYTEDINNTEMWDNTEDVFASFSNYDIQVYGKTALAYHDIHWTGKIGGEAIDSQQKRIVHFVKEDGTWKLDLIVQMAVPVNELEVED